MVESKNSGPRDPGSASSRLRIGVATVCTGDYWSLFPEFATAAQAQFFPEEDLTCYALTDQSTAVVPDGCRILPTPHLSWPGPTLVRYHLLLSHAAELQELDYLFLVDVDLRFQQPVGREILGDIVVVNHYRLTGVRAGLLPYERRRSSSAFVDFEEGNAYLSGAFVGGKLPSFLLLARRIVELVALDSRRHFTAVWHDESYLNRALIGCPGVSVLPESFLGPAFGADPSNYRAVLEPNLGR